MSGCKAFAHILSIIVFIQMSCACWISLQGERCCKDIGTGVCFGRSSLFTALPQCPSSYDPEFTLYTRTQRTGTTFSRTTIPGSFSNNKRTVFIVHGWMTSFSSSSYQELKDALLQQENLNVIGVDWREGASALTYIPSAANTQSLGALIGAYVNRLRTIIGQRRYFWCIGHSLGAHACGFSSLTATQKLDRITGLDPAGPLFPRNAGLTKDSAVKVDVIHTDALFGSLSPRGDVDFYPNGGRAQPGCVLSLPIHTARSDTDFTDEERIKYMQRAVTERGIFDCNHQRAFFYMLNSVRDTSCYTARKTCTDVGDIPASCTDIPATEAPGYMGYWANYGKYTGNLYFKPGPVSPFCAI